MNEEKSPQNAMPTEPQSEEAKKNENLYGNVYDNLVKNFFSLVFVFADFLCNYADPDFVSKIEADKIFAAPTHYISPKGHEQMIDLVFKVPLKNSATPLLAVIVFEHQNDSLWDIPRKLIKYITAVWETESKNNEPLSVPYFIVLRTGKKTLAGLPPNMCDRFPKGKDGKPIGMKISVEYKLIDLPAWDFDKLVGRAEVRVILGILKKMIEGDPDGTFDSWPEALLPLKEIKDEKIKIELTRDVLDFVAKILRRHNQRLETEMVSKALNPIFEEKVDNMMKTIFEEKFDEGLAVGEARGEARVEKEKIEIRRETILQVLANRMNGVPRELEEKVQKITDVEKLKQLITVAAICESLNEFENALD